MWAELLRALALVMIIEGLMPFIAPERWRQMLLRVVTIDANSLRVFGAVMIAGGVIALQLMRT